MSVRTSTSSFLYHSGVRWASLPGSVMSDLDSLVLHVGQKRTRQDPGEDGPVDGEVGLLHHQGDLALVASVADLFDKVLSAGAAPDNDDALVARLLASSLRVPRERVLELFDVVDVDLARLFDDGESQEVAEPGSVLDVAVADVEPGAVEGADEGAVLGQDAL